MQNKGLILKSNFHPDNLGNDTVDGVVTSDCRELQF